MDNKIKDIMATILEVSIDDLDENSSQATLESWDSLKHMQLIIAIEEEFDVEIEDIDLIEMISFQTIKDALQIKLN